MKFRFLFAVTALIAACGPQPAADNNAADSTVAAKTETAAPAGSSAQSDTASQLVAELQRLQRALQSGDPQALKDFYDFPLADEAFKFSYSEAQALQQAAKQGKPGLSEEAFVRLYGAFREQQQYDSLLAALNRVPPARLLKEPEATVEDRSGRAACYLIYTLRREGSTLQISYGTNSNPDFRGSDEDVEENGCAEFAYIWQLELRQGKLKFVGLEMAG